MTIAEKAANLAHDRGYAVTRRADFDGKDLGGVHKRRGIRTELREEEPPL